VKINNRQDKHRNMTQVKIFEMNCS